MSGQFYAFTDIDEAQSLRPAWFVGDQIIPPRVVVSTKGVIITPGDDEIEAEMSAPFVVLSNQVDGPDDNAIEPDGRQGFA